MRRAALLAAVAGAALLAPAAGASAAPLRAGAGKADVTPQLGYFLGGWTRADRTSHGQHTRLRSRALVLQEGSRKVALVQVDLFMVSGGLLKHAADLNADRGFSERNMLASASHTHSGPGGYANFKTFNTAAPSLQTATDPISYYRLFDPKPADPQLYSFLVRQIAKAIRRADDDLGPAAAGWGQTEIHGLTQNRSIEAHLADHGILREFGEGSVALDPAGVNHTIDPEVNVLRVDKLVRRKGKRRHVPIGGWSTFANHGTVTKSSFQFYNEDHFASAMQVFEAKVRKAGRVPKGQEVLDRAFVIVQGRVKRRWRTVTSDLGLEMLWHMDGENRYVAKWEIPLDAARGTYRMVVHANRYGLVSRSFRVRNSKSLSLRQVQARPGRVAVALENPVARRDIDLTYRPPNANGGAVRFQVGKRTVLVRRKRGGVFSVRAPAGRQVTVLRARDRHGNVAAGQLGLGH